MANSQRLMAKNMNAKDIRIVFMGTPEFAVPSLKALVEGGYNVVGVVTMPDKPAGRGIKLQESDVKRAAKELGIETILQPEKLRDEEFLEALRALQPDLGIVIAFRILQLQLQDITCVLEKAGGAASPSPAPYAQLQPHRAVPWG